MITFLLKNAVAPDWNLKWKKSSDGELSPDNAVAPDWNLKLANGYEKKDFYLMQSHQIGI